jgi:hypothetical protein
MNNFEFTFKTYAEYWSARITGYIAEYKCVRMEVAQNEGGTHDFPLHCEEEYNEYLTKYLIDHSRIVRTYPTTSFYESEYCY